MALYEHEPLVCSLLILLLRVVLLSASLLNSPLQPNVGQRAGSLVPGPSIAASALPLLQVLTIVESDFTRPNIRAHDVQVYYPDRMQNKVIELACLPCRALVSPTGKCKPPSPNVVIISIGAYNAMQMQ